MEKARRTFDRYPQILSPGIIMLALCGSVLVYAATARPVHLDINGSESLLRTHARTVMAALRDAGVVLGKEDHVQPSQNEKLIPGMTIRVQKAREVTIRTGGEIKKVQTIETSPENILLEAGFRVFPGDRIGVTTWLENSSGVQVPKYPLSVHLNQGVDLEIIDSGTSILIRSAGATVGDVLWEAGIILYEGDDVKPHPGAFVSEGDRIEIARSQPVVFEADDEVVHTRAAGKTVGEALAQAGIVLTGMDYAVPEIEAPIPSDGRIRVVRVQEKILSEMEPIPFSTVYQPADYLELDTLEVISTGSYGVVEKRIRLRIEDGVEVERSVDEAVPVIEPKPRVVGYGTKIVIRTLDTGSGTIEYWRAIPVYATSYSPCRIGTSYCGSLTASGRTVVRGVIGVIRSWYNQMRGWPVFVPVYGPGSIEDIGAGFADKDWIDLGFTDDKYEAWHDWTTLYFLTPVPPLDSIPWILP
ncbi:MAG: ubiquitin-like domain-containing protein [Anaerolineales bacterium]|nr:ubiquitin-like domain-containing protein [Anaerolineales bacterium]